MRAFHSGSDQSWIGYNEMGMPAVAAKYCEHRVVSAM
jgi:hypothetical protein